MKVTGIVLLILGILLTVFTSLRIFETKEVAQIGSLEVNKKETKRFNWPPVLGIIVMGIGGVVLWQAARK